MYIYIYIYVYISMTDPAAGYSQAVADVPS